MFLLSTVSIFEIAVITLTLKLRILFSYLALFVIIVRLSNTYFSVNHYSANPTKKSNTLKQFVGFSTIFVGLLLKECRDTYVK